MSFKKQTASLEHNHKKYFIRPRSYSNEVGMFPLYAFIQIIGRYFPTNSSKGFCLFNWFDQHVINIELISCHTCELEVYINGPASAWASIKHSRSFEQHLKTIGSKHRK